LTQNAFWFTIVLIILSRFIPLQKRFFEHIVAGSKKRTKSKRTTATLIIRGIKYLRIPIVLEANSDG